MDYLYRRRGISAEVARIWKLGVTELCRDGRGVIESATWTIPINSGGGELAGVKLHRDLPVNRNEVNRLDDVDAATVAVKEAV